MTLPTITCLFELTVVGSDGDNTLNPKPKALPTLQPPITIDPLPIPHHLFPIPHSKIQNPKSKMLQAS